MKKLLLIALAAVLVVAFCAPAMAATKKVSFYGDIRYNTYWVTADEDYYANGLGDDDSDLQWIPDWADSRFGARFSEGPISANVELRPVSASIFRQWWGQWDFGPAQLLIGHTYVPGCLAPSMSQADSENAVVFGNFMDRLRTSQIRLTVPFSMGSFVIAALDNPANDPEWAGAGPPANYDTDVSMPEIEARLTLKIAPAQIDLVGGFATFDAVDKSTEDSENISSNILAVRVVVPFGPLYVKGLYVQMKNPGNWGDLSSTTLQFTKMRFDTTTGQTEDSDYTCFGGLVGFKINDMVTAEAGYFQQKTERYLQEEDTNGTYYVMAAITPIKGVTIYPEFAVQNFDDFTDAAGVTTEEGKKTFLGAYWKIAF